MGMMLMAILSMRRTRMDIKGGERMIMVVSPYKAEDGTQIMVHESPQYFMVTVRGKTWYWSKEDGKFDGTSWDVKK